MKVMVEPLKVIVAPVLGIPLAVKLALNQMKLPDSTGVPLKLEMFVEGEQVDCAAAELANNIAVQINTITDDCFMSVWNLGSVRQQVGET